MPESNRSTHHKGINLHIYPSRFAHRTRILKQMRAIWDWHCFDEIHVVAIHDGVLPQEEQIGPDQRVFRLTIPAILQSGGRLRRVLAHLFWMVKIHRTYAKQTIRCINCHNLGTLGLGVWFKIRYGSLLIYDAHELETQRNGWPTWLCWATGVIERLLIRWVDQLIVVGPAIAAWYQNHYGLPDNRVHVVRNVPQKQPIISESIDLKRRMGIPAHHILCIYVGLLDSGRNITMMLESFSRCHRSDIHLLMLGYGPLSNTCQSMAHAHDTIHYHPAVAPDQVVNYITAADVGLVLIEQSCLSYYYCLPNKLFECLMAGVPVLTSDFPEMSQIVHTHACGWCIPPADEALVNFLQELHISAIEQKHHGAKQAASLLDWHHEANTMKQAYQEIIDNTQKY
ncbi:MAG: glycosyltransferase [Magnetococcales bacterium]|nr:glycosyltransferase [Magnetococcales bacterium]